MNNHFGKYIVLLIGTNEGVYRASIDEIGDTISKVLDSKHVLRVRRFGKEIFAATRSGLYRSADRGETWANLNVPQTEVYSVLKSPSGKSLYAGTHPAHLYISNDAGASWEELKHLQNVPSRDSWSLPRHRNEAHVRSLGGHSDVPDRIIAGIEVGGVHISEDRGETWIERRDGLHDDVHHVLIRGAEEYIASTGGGLYRTCNAGQSWTRLDTELGHTYFREAFAAGDWLYAAAARSAPPTWGGKQGADAALFESADEGDTFKSVPYPGQPEEFILAWTAFDGNVLGGTHGGHILQRAAGEWKEIGSIHAAIRSLAVA